jgi:pyrrolysine biosynthesis protein PylC
VEAAVLARRAGWTSVLADARPAPPAAFLADSFHIGRLASLSDLDRVLGPCDLVLPTCENPETWELLAGWRGRGNAPPVAFDWPAWRLSRDKATSKRLFEKLAVPAPLDYPRAAFPLIAKPVDASGSRGVRRLDSPAELARLFPGGAVGPGWVVEEFCPGPSYSLEVTGRPGDYETWTVTRLFMDQGHDCRQVVCPAGLSRAEEEEFRALALRLAEGVGLTGLMDVEVILTPGGFLVLEIDARLPSQTPAAICWATGENLLVRLARLFGGPAAAPSTVPSSATAPAAAPATALATASSAAAARAAIYEQVAPGAGGLESVGEHRLSLAGPLRWEEDFCGADLALTDWGRDRAHWAAALIVTGRNLAEARERRREALARLSLVSGRPLSPSLLEEVED